jgi:hypothetical protein
MSEQIIGGFKEYIVIERDSIKELEEYAKELENDKGLHTRGMAKGILYTIDKIKTMNIYNKDFKIKN